MTESSQKSGKPRGKGKPFAKGVTGNPGGRPKLTPEALDLIQACKDKTPQALNVIIDIMENGQIEKNRLMAAQSIIERGYGKAEQPVKADISGNLVVEIVRYGSAAG